MRRKIAGTENERMTADVRGMKRGESMRAIRGDAKRRIKVSKTILKPRQSILSMRRIVKRRGSYERRKLIWTGGIRWRRSIRRVQKMKKT